MAKLLSCISGIIFLWFRVVICLHKQRCCRLLTCFYFSPNAEHKQQDLGSLALCLGLSRLTKWSATQLISFVGFTDEHCHLLHGVLPDLAGCVVY